MKSTPGATSMEGSRPWSAWATTETQMSATARISQEGVLRALPVASRATNGTKSASRNTSPMAAFADSRTALSGSSRKASAASVASVVAAIPALLSTLRITIHTQASAGTAQRTAIENGLLPSWSRAATAPAKVDRPSMAMAAVENCHRGFNEPDRVTVMRGNPDQAISYGQPRLRAARQTVSPSIGDGTADSTAPDRRVAAKRTLRDAAEP
jgi:hypothetical protein